LQGFRAVSIVFCLYSYMALITVASDYLPGSRSMTQLPYFNCNALTEFFCLEEMEGCYFYVI